MICVHRKNLTCVIASFVRMLLVHVKGNAYLGKDTRMDAHVIEALLADRLELVSEGVTDGGFSNLDG